MKKNQPSRKRTDWISNHTKELMKNRDVARTNAVRSNQEEDSQEYRQLSNLCNFRVKADINKNLHRENDSKGLYKFTKKKMGWKNAGSLELFLINGEQIMNYKKRLICK